MSSPSYIIRNYKPADFGKFLQLTIEADEPEPSGHYTSPQALNERLSRPHYSPEHDLFVVERAGAVIGYMDLTPEPSIRRVILTCFIHPSYRRQGLASKLLGHAVHRCQELGTKVVHVNIRQDNIAAKSTLSKFGFKLVRRFLHLRLDISKVRWQDMNQATLQYRYFRCGEDERLTQIQNRCFARTWGYNPNTVQEITYLTNLTNFSPQDIVLASDGDKSAGYCWTRTTYKGESDERVGQIFMLGVDPCYRGRGIGKRVLLAGLSYMKRKGIQLAELTVDNRNKVACSLYRTIGFEVQSSSLWYEKRIG